jgi:cytochrome c oxidase cbb3-type subunit III
MKNWLVSPGLLVVASLTCVACSGLPGRPALSALPVNPDDVTDFATLYETNCSGCHGQDGHGGGPALSLADPVYLAIADESVMKKAAENGIAGTSMAAFAKSAGGLLTNKQVEIIVNGIRQRYSNPHVLAGVTPPPYAAKLGDTSRGAGVFQRFCASCHGPEGKGGPKASSIVDGSFLALLTDQELRTLTIVGRPDLNAPDWRNNVPGKPMSDQDISDVVAWLASQRPNYPGQPFPAPAKSEGGNR